MRELHVLFFGKVQLVGFRVTLFEHAKKLKLLGIIKNLPDGSVEATLQGSQAALQIFLKRASEDSRGAHIDYYDEQFSEIKHPHTTLSII